MVSKKRPASGNESQMPSGPALVAAVAEIQVFIAGRTSTHLLDALLRDPRLEQGALDAEPQVEVRPLGSGRIVGHIGAEERAEHRGELGADLVAGALDARPDGGDH